MSESDSVEVPPEKINDAGNHSDMDESVEMEQVEPDGQGKDVGVGGSNGEGSGETRGEQEEHGVIVNNDNKEWHVKKSCMAPLDNLHPDLETFFERPAVKGTWFADGYTATRQSVLPRGARPGEIYNPHGPQPPPKSPLVICKPVLNSPTEVIAPPRTPSNANRPPPPIHYKCHSCHKPGHWRDECTENKGMARPIGQYLCRICKVPGHFIEVCPEKIKHPQMGSTGTPKEPPPPDNLCTI
jgi:hypothetical protein